MFQSAYNQRMKILLTFIFLIGIQPVIAQTKLPQFSDYPVKVYRGKIHKPKWLHRGSEGEWRDSQNKLVGDPVVAFAGRYHVGAHSLGAGARYYSLTDLSTGRESNALYRFATSEPIPRLRDRREFLTLIYTRPNSRLIVAQYLIDYTMTSIPECRERSFLFENGKIRPISKTIYRCRKLD
jgi:hypothetical protein